MLDENRVLATDANCQGKGCKDVPAYDGDPAADMGALRVVSDCHFAVQLNRFIPGFLSYSVLIAVFRK